MSIQHRDIPEAELHELKGASTASSNTAPFSNGSGTAVWQKVDTTKLKGVTTDGGASGKKLLTDGTEGFVLRTDAACGSMGFAGNSTNFAVTAAVDANLDTNSDYVLFTGTGAPHTSSNLIGITFSTDRLTVPVTGIYMINTWMSIRSFPALSSRISIKYRINGTTLSSRHPIAKSNSTGDVDQLIGFGLVSLSAGDYVQVMVASTSTGNLLINDANTALTLVQQTA